MGTPEGLRGLMDLVSVEEARGHQINLMKATGDGDGDIRLLQRYADTVIVMDAEKKRAEETVRSLEANLGRLTSQLDSLEANLGRLTSQLDSLAALKVQELVDAVARAEAAEAELAAVRKARIL